MTIAEREADDPDVRVSGSQDGWIDALGPNADSSSLLADGDGRLASVLLDSVGALAERGVVVA